MYFRDSGRLGSTNWGYPATPSPHLPGQGPLPSKIESTPLHPETLPSCHSGGLDFRRTAPLAHLSPSHDDTCVNSCHFLFITGFGLPRLLEAAVPPQVLHGGNVRAEGPAETPELQVIPSHTPSPCSLNPCPHTRGPACTCHS